MKEVFRKKLAGAAKQGRRLVMAATVGAVALGSISYTKAAGIEDIFDEVYYADKYPDLKAAYGYDRAALLEHFKNIGASEGRAMNEMIDIVKYRETYKDLQAAFEDDWDAYVEHYLSYGAFEHRDNGTGFDPVDYLNRYGELKEAFGNDILAACRHYEDHGKQEGREARSEAVVKAEEEALEWEDTYTPEEEPGQPEQEAYKIESVEIMGTGRIRVTLNRETDQTLALGAFSIICNSGGSDMTILSVSTEDNRVYDLSTTYYKDQEYDIQITLPDGTAISKVFDYRTDCAQIAGITAVRTGTDEAAITFNSDEPGYFYYILRENVQRRLRAAVSSTEPTEAEVIRDGIKVEMKQHENTVIVTGLTEGVSYTVYYVAVNTENKSTLVNSLSIDGEVYEEKAEAIKGAEAFAEKLSNGEFLYGFEIELETATSEPLTLDQFDISCPQNETTLGEVRTTDNRVYRVYMQRGSIPKGNNTYTILINMKDGTQLKGTCYLDLQAPRVSARSIEWTDKDTIKVVVNSDEAGMLYYAVQDQVEGEGTIVSKDPTQLYASGTKVDIGYGLNYITIKGIKAGQWFCFASEDAKGNREDFYSYKQIPEYSEPSDEDESTQPEITGVTVIKASNQPTLKVVFNQPMMGIYDNTNTQISGLNGRLSLSTRYDSEGGLQDNVLIITVIKFPSISQGNHTLTIALESGETLTYDFTV